DIEGYGRIVYKGARFTINGYLTTDNGFIVVFQFIFLKKFLQTVSIYLEKAFYHTFLVFPKKMLSLRTVAQYEPQRTHHNGFTCSCLSGNNIQPRVKLDIQVFD